MRFIILLLITFMLASLGPDIGAAEDYFQQTVHYTIRVRLDPQNQMLTGTETILYTNNSPDTLRELYLHLYPNAFQSKHTALMTDYLRRYNFTILDLPKKYQSYLKISDVLVDGTNVEPIIDDTIAQMDLPHPLLPGASIELSLRLEEKVGRQIGRGGHKNNQFDMAQWYPKLVVYDEDLFHPDKYRFGEFYGEFADFDVYIEVPEHYVVAATGVVTDGDPGWNINSLDNKTSRSNKTDRSTPYKTIHFSAENVHDFAWNTSPDFVVQDSTWNGVEIRSFSKRNNKEWQDSTLIHGVRAIEWLSDRFGPYPYPQMSIVKGLMSGGMEYPMLVMNGVVSESLVLHEVGHCYFYGILGNDERADAWLDEGFTTYQTGWYLKERYGEYGDTGKWNWYQRLTPQYSLLEGQRQWVYPLLRRGYGERVGKRSEDFKHNYFSMVYGKASLMLYALRYVVGDENFERILKDYYERWKFKHVNEERFRSVCEEISGMDLGWFFEQWLHTKKLCDYRLSKLETRASDRGDGYATSVKIERLGDVTMPLSLQFTFPDGEMESTRIAGRMRTINKTYTFPERPTKVALNPANEILDLNMSDNFLPRRRTFQVDWPKNAYYPEDAYQIRYRPAAWYNDVDGAKVGLHLRGSYDAWRRPLSAGIYYGAESGRLDFSVSYTRPTMILGKRTKIHMSGYKMEGREDATFELSYRRRLELNHPPTHRFSFGFNHHELTNTRFVIDRDTYQIGTDFAPYFGYEVNPQADLFRTNLKFGLRFGREWFGGDYSYTRFTGSTVLKTRRLLMPFDAGLRLFIGALGGSMPFQQKFSLADGGPLAKDRQFYLRSPGAVWEDIHYHEPGQGNLRGYWDGSFGVNRLFALNFEVGAGVPLISRGRKSFLGNLKTRAFFDLGRILDTENPIGSSERVAFLVDGGILDRTIVDAGVGIDLIRDFPFYNLHLRFDVPFYVSHPEINGETDEVDFRYVFSLKSTF